MGEYIDRVRPLLRLANVGVAGLRWSAEAEGWAEVAGRVAGLQQRNPGAFAGLLDARATFRPSGFERLIDKTELATYAREQADSGFPDFFETLLVRLWSVLETDMRGRVGARIQRLGPSDAGPRLSAVKGPVFALLHASESERAEYLVKQLEQDTGAPLKDGVGRFEALLDAVGLGGTTPDALRRVILEMSASRNVIVHNDSFVDDRFVGRCPWLGLSVGDRVKVGPDVFYMYAVAVYAFQLQVETRTQRLIPDVKEADACQRVLDSMVGMIDSMYARRAEHVNRETNMPTPGSDQNTDV